MIEILEGPTNFLSDSTETQSSQIGEILFAFFLVGHNF